MFCSNCGKEIEEGAAFCSSCGAAVPVEPAASEAPAAPAASVTPTAPEASAAPPEALTGAVVSAAPVDNGAKNTKKEKTPGKKKGKGGLIVAIVLIVLILCIGVGSALYFTGDNYKTKKYLKLANAYYEEGEYDDALDYYEQALELDSTLLEAYLNSADVYLSTGDYKEAVSLLKKAIKNFKNADDEEAMEELIDMLAEAYLAGIEEELGDHAFDTAHKLAKNGLKDTDNKVFSKKQVEIYGAEADYYMQSHDYYSALYTLENGYEDTGDDSLMEKRLDIYKLAADNYLQDGDYRGALSMLQTGYYATGDSGLTERLTDVYLAYAESYAAGQDYDTAIQILSEGQAVTGAERISSRMNELTAERNAQHASGGNIDPYTGYALYIDPYTGQPYDLGGVEIVIRDWFSPDWPDAPENEFEDAQQDYREWIQKTYNFTIREQRISDWGSAPVDFVDYVTTGGDDHWYAFTLRDDAVTTSAMANDFMWDLTELDCLDFSEEKFTKNKTYEKYTHKGHVYCMYAGDPEPRTGIFFNKRVLREANIDPQSIYDMQANGTWTWDAWTDIMDMVQSVDYYGDGYGYPDVWGFNVNNGDFTLNAIYSNGGELVGKDASGNYVYRLEDQATLEALEWAVDVFTEYMQEEPWDAQWDYYWQAFTTGEVAFLVADAYNITGYQLANMTDDWGFVAFPKGPNSTGYTNCWIANPVCIPSCYDKDKAWKIAFAWNLYTEPIPGYEENENWKKDYRDYARDWETVDETLQIMVDHGMVTYHSVIPNLDTGEPFLWKIGKYTDIYEVIANIRDDWKYYIADANARR